MKKKFILRMMAWLLTVAMLLPSAGIALTTAYAEEEKAAYSSSVTFSDSTYWTNKEISRDELLGTVNPDDVAFIQFSCDDTVFCIGYNSTKTNEYWQQSTDNLLSSYVSDDINFLSDKYYLQVMISKGDGVNYTINWDVYTGDAKVPTAGGATEATGDSYTIITESTDFGGTNSIPVSAFEKCQGGGKNCGGIYTGRCSLVESGSPQ